MNQGIGQVETPVWVNTCLSSDNINGLIQFYRQILRMPAEVSDSKYASFHTGPHVLPPYSVKAREKCIAHSSQSASNRSAIPEFRVVQINRE